MDRMAFFMASPAIFRRLIFRLCEQLPRYQAGYIGSCYGCPTEISNRTESDIYIGTMHLHELRSPERVTTFVNSTLSKYLEPEAQPA